MEKELVSHLNDYYLHKIVAYGDLKITPDMAQDELNIRYGKKDEAFEKYENKYFIKKTPDSVKLYKMGEYNKSNRGMYYDRLTFSLDENESDWNEAVVQLTEGMFIDKLELECKFANIVETTKDVYDKYMIKYRDSFEIIRKMIND
jgi:hypothetical protein